MDKDRTEICKIISEMLDNPDENGIYPQAQHIRKLELYIEAERFKAIGWTHADACIALDKGDDPRIQNIPEILERAKKDLAI